jgi:hypothetical protein
MHVTVGIKLLQNSMEALDRSMSKAEILAALSTLRAEERSQVFERLCELQDADLIQGAAPTETEKRLPDEALAEFHNDGNRGLPWRDALRDIRAARTP